MQQVCVQGMARLHARDVTCLGAERAQSNYCFLLMLRGSAKLTGEVVMDVADGAVVHSRAKGQVLL